MGEMSRRLFAPGLLLEDDLSEKRWKEIGEDLRREREGYGWRVGEWLNYARRYDAGELTEGRYKLAEELTGLEYDTLKNYASVAGKFPKSRRHDKPELRASRGSCRICRTLGARAGRLARQGCRARLVGESTAASDQRAGWQARFERWAADPGGAHHQDHLGRGRG